MPWISLLIPVPSILFRNFTEFTATGTASCLGLRRLTSFMSSLNIFIINWIFFFWRRLRHLVTHTLMLSQTIHCFCKPIRRMFKTISTIGKIGESWVSCLAAFLGVATSVGCISWNRPRFWSPLPKRQVVWTIEDLHNSHHHFRKQV